MDYKTPILTQVSAVCPDNSIELTDAVGLSVSGVLQV